LSRDAQLTFLGDFAGRSVLIPANAYVRIRFDLTQQLTLYQRVFRASATLDEDNGVDSAPSSRLVNNPVVTLGTVSPRLPAQGVYQDLFGLAPNALYVLTFWVTIGSPTLTKTFKVAFFTSS
jgi:hypothetical protein